MHIVVHEDGFRLMVACMSPSNQANRKSTDECHRRNEKDDNCQRHPRTQPSRHHFFPTRTRTWIGGGGGRENGICWGNFFFVGCEPNMNPQHTHATIIPIPVHTFQRSSPQQNQPPTSHYNPPHSPGSSRSFGHSYLVMGEWTFNRCGGCYLQQSVRLVNVTCCECDIHPERVSTARFMCGTCVSSAVNVCDGRTLFLLAPSHRGVPTSSLLGTRFCVQCRGFLCSTCIVKLSRCCNTCRSVVPKHVQAAFADDCTPLVAVICKYAYFIIPPVEDTSSIVAKPPDFNEKGPPEETRDLFKNTNLMLPVPHPHNPFARL